MVFDEHGKQKALIQSWTSLHLLGDVVHEALTDVRGAIRNSREFAGIRIGDFIHDWRQCSGSINDDNGCRGVFIRTFISKKYPRACPNKSKIDERFEMIKGWMLFYAERCDVVHLDFKSLSEQEL